MFGFTGRQVNPAVIEGRDNLNMTSTNHEILIRKERLLSKTRSAYPGMRTGPVREIAPTLDFKGFHELWKQAWGDTYALRPVFDYDPAYLEWAFGDEALTSPLSFAAADEADLAGVVLHAHRELMHEGRRITAGMPGGLSIRPDIKGAMLAKVLSLLYIEQAVEDLDALFMWFDTSTRAPQKVGAVYRRMYGHGLKLAGDSVCIGTCEMVTKPHDPVRIQRLLPVKRHEAFMSRAVVAFDRCFPARPRGHVATIDTGSVDEAREFANHCAELGGYGRVFGEQEFRRYTLYKNPETGVGPFSALMRHRGRIRAIGVGYPLTVICLGKRDTSFYIPCLTFDSQCTPSERSAFASHFANMAREACNSCCTLTMCPLGIAARFVSTGLRFVCFGVPLRGALAVVDAKNPTRTIDFR